MRKKRLIGISLLSVMLIILACNVPIGQQTDSSSQIQTLVAMNVAQTQLAATITAVAQAGSSTTSGLAEPSVTAMVLSEPSVTPTITLTLLPSFTPTPQGVWLTLNENTNCRVGPASYYTLVIAMKAGQQLEAVGRSTFDGYYYVRNPFMPNGFCWMWDRYSSLTGNTNSLPVYTPQPTPTFTVTPTPAADITVSFVSVTTCDNQYALRLYLKNTGSTTWQSVKVVVNDNTTGTNLTHISDEFKGFNGCSSDIEQADLTPGEDGIVSNVNPGQFDYNPAGHNLTVTVTVYSTDGLGGTSVSKTINITP